MDYAEKFENVSVLGAAGKMGSGILMLTAFEMANLSLKPENKGKTFTLHAIDVSQEALSGLLKNIKSQVLKNAEKNIVQLRKVYANRADLIENIDIINQYIGDVLKLIVPHTHIEASYKSTLIFEAIKEDPDLKVKVFKKINEINTLKPWFFTNTSSIPISYIDKEAKLEGRILGVHFYNPPAVQKLVEVIKSENTKPELHEFASMLIKNLRKIEVPSYDKAGFIGNGHFMRDALYGMEQATKLSVEMPFVEAIYDINKITQDYLIRPMGIFQLIDYVGIDVCQYIMKVMKPYVKDENIHSPLLDKFMELGVKGGQNANGSQKDGFLKYDKGKPVAIYDPAQKQYVAISDISAKCEQKLGAMPATVKPWKVVVGNPAKEEILKKYFAELKTMDTIGANLARNYAKRSKEIGVKLVSNKVAYCDKDVNTVLLTGFFHAYGPINDYLN
ncbi:MAG: 3-hydroxybutyryl-CoA dehydrogenase [Bacteroidetes bacterium CG02_land_8_20_14_3_00_31_25]|nr:3-hydroxyacyl-CoA dehydrogenase family protein [Bacteroidota bacterium]PIV63181.1 MAG: 3-hydroxybutyryl-CoA dehydrogenase [Bacteroidetes bacterium CG02_land_8_20_14_3_00_31_25]PIX34553.1 MAG: 3-hydroxybutyryl-CoA dehydrogenase [Bacteroidetes bacterium CG_4_8_14_3_um_filter_31_14]PIY04648.1 MAG: 3-hydroxybutyryl-CoA dehydrogenase [Bacteroidetes bacterium CG_4_10_14_3_um_filter_31_20]